MFFTLPLLGVAVRVRGLHHLDGSSARVLVSNHISDFDPIALWAACPIAQLVLVTNDVWKTVVALTRRLGFPVTCVWTKAGGAKQSIAEHLSSKQHCGKKLLIFPEGATTNGKGMLTFFDFIFSLKYPILPFTIQYYNPYPINIDYAGSDLRRNLLTVFLLPLVFYTYTFYPEVTPAPDGTTEAYCGQIRAVLSEKLGVPATCYGLQDKIQLKKRYVAL